MKKITAISALGTLSVAALLASGPAAAQQTTNTNNALLSFQGAVIDSTCTISSSAGDPMLITLPTVSTTAFGSVGATTGTTPFTITVKNCTASLTKAVPFFDYASTVAANANVNSAGRLKNTTASGSNVELQISDPSAGVVGLNTPWASVGALPTTTPQKVTTQSINGGNATFNFTVQYQ